MASKKLKSAFAGAGLIYSAAIWGSTFFIVKDALSGVDPVIMVAYRFLLAGIILLLFLIFTKRNALQNLRRGFILALALWILYILQTIGLQYTTASNSGFITGLFVAFIPVFNFIIFGRKSQFMELLAVFLALLGLWILTGGLRDINTGDILTVGAAVMYALHVLFADKYMKGGSDAYVLSCQQFLFMGIFSVIAGIIFNLPFTIAGPEIGWVIVFLALFPTLSAFVIQLLSQKLVAPLKVSLIFATEPVFAAVFAWTFGGETPILHRALGGVLIFISLVVSGLPSPKIFARGK
ncbi:MAG: DMT family transporter [candidate division Zixibacteria bacterium]